MAKELRKRNKKNKKLKAKKLEERIAPGMLGGGIVDPGMAEPCEDEQPQEHDANQIQETETEYNGGAIYDESGNYAGTGEYQEGNFVEPGLEGGDYSGISSEDHSINSEEYQNNSDGDPNYQADVQEISGDSAPDEGGYGDEAPAWTEADWTTQNADGSFHVEPPEGVTVDDGIASFPVDVANETVTPDYVELQDDGSALIDLPEGTEFNLDAQTMTFPEGSVQFAEIPDVMDATQNEDGSITMPIQEGMTVDQGANQLELDNHWVNEACPDSCQVAEDGSLEVALPADTEFQKDGSFDVPAEDMNFIDDPEPPYLECGMVEYQNDGSYLVEPPADMSVDAEAGTLTMPVDSIDEHFEGECPEDVTFNSDGSADVNLPEGTLFDAESNSLTFPEGELYQHEIPEGMEYTLNDDGTLSVTLPDGMEYQDGSLHVSNEWVNEITPESCEFSEEGSLTVNLPEDCQYHDDGSFSIPEDSAGFLYDEGEASNSAA